MMHSDSIHFDTNRINTGLILPDQKSVSPCGIVSK